MAEQIMSLSSGNIYSIPEHPSEDDFIEEGYSELSPDTKGIYPSNATKKVSSTSLPEKPHVVPKQDEQQNKDSPPAKATLETPVAATGSDETFQRDPKRLSVSLYDIPTFDISSESGIFKADNGGTFANVSSSHLTSANNSKSYLEVQDCFSHSNHGRECQTPLSAAVHHDGSSNNDESNAVNNRARSGNNERKNSDNLVFIDLNEEVSKCPIHEEGEDAFGPSVLRQRSRSLQWIQNTFQNVSNKYKWILEIRRPSDIVEERMRRSREELEEMEEPEYESLSEKPSTGTARRFSENIAGKQKRFFPFASRFGGHLKDLWRDKSPASRRQEEKDSDQTRPDVCPLFTFPRKGDEDEQILDALRQAMRKCTAVDPTARPSSSTVLDQLSKLLD